MIDRGRELLERPQSRVEEVSDTSSSDPSGVSNELAEWLHSDALKSVELFIDELSPGPKSIGPEWAESDPSPWII